MQTIENSLLRVTIDEKGARMVNFVAQNDQVDYLKNSTDQKQLAVTFKKADQEENWATLLPWTVVDKGDTRVSLALIDDAVSYKKFPYHFEIILTYALEGNRIDIKCYVKNNSHKEMPFSLSLTLPILDEWISSENVNEVELTDRKAKLKLTSTNFALALKNEQVIASVNDVKLASDSDDEFLVTMTLN
ncbi:aldose epimerase [Lactobacillus sp. ESL0785]|uniref:aldose epimerase family protein n=1 Tax=Lactobacillus sp. ESL0785 TaxID=2983232 RepID=UPI0023F70593|nr:aldose epimerase [Lactobacillus sp. ESL0785]WEV70669.1 aldose epimerase [Lactobacillus sp. ESL0785]